MRRIGTLSDTAQAGRFRNYLLTRGVDSVIDADSDGVSCEIWIHNEDDVEVARREFAQFQASPGDEQFDVDDEAERIRQAQVDQRWQQRQQRIGSQPIDPEPIDPEVLETDQSKIAVGSTDREPTNSRDNGEPFDNPTPLLDSETRQTGFPVTMAIMALSVIASFATNMGQPRGSRIPGKVTMEQQIFYALSFVDRRDYGPQKDSFASIKKGEAWRIITPMFLHGNMFHLFFNMFFIFLLGSMIERIHGSYFFLILALLTQIAGMMVQVLLPDAAFMPESLRGSPFAIGASGVAYGLFGFMWIRPLLDSDYPIELDSTQFMIIIAGLIICMTPIVPHVANGAHLGGLAAGMMIAAIGFVIRR
jgi:GlpG protein